MKRITTLVLAGLFAGGLLANCGADNVAACEAAADKLTALKCVPEASKTGYDKATICVATINDSGIDQTKYYECWGNLVTCKSDTELGTPGAACTFATE